MSPTLLVYPGSGVSNLMSDSWPVAIGYWYLAYISNF